MKFRVSIHAEEKEYEIEANDNKEAVRAAITKYRAESNLNYITSCLGPIDCDTTEINTSYEEARESDFNTKEEYISPERAAYELDISLRLMCDMMRNNEIPAFKDTLGAWCVPRKAISLLKRRNKQ